ncbi:MAG TPA: SRPBCC domain-containing protein [Chryseosolibacter sp.]|nr:SRPBCC domain-containing protein [Chryseosolibacter sp.]
MTHSNFSMSFLVNKSPEKVFDTVLDVRRWWTGLYDETIEGRSDILNESFTFRAGGGAHYSKHKLIEAIPHAKVTWETTDAALSFVQRKTEWTGTKMSFTISKKDNKTQLTFTHEGLVPEMECYDSCSGAWSQYLREKLMTVLSKD